MSTKKNQLDSYRKSLLNRVTASVAFTEYIENCLAREDEAAKYSFHKVMVHNWSGTDVQLFDILSEYFSIVIIPVMYSSNSEITSFYTSSLSFLLKMLRLDFMFPFQRNMFNIDILFNNKNSIECFHNEITIEDIVCGVVSGRMNENFELDLSNFCSDPEFEDKKIHFYKISLLSHFKILMLRMGRDTKSLNLSNNKLSQLPLDIMNFFIKGDLTAINLSNNELPSVQELFRVSSKIERLWLEGNPLCDELDPTEYIKLMTKKFPRLMELDGIKINYNGYIFPPFKNYLVTPDRRTKMIVEKFLTLYFTHYDSTPRNKTGMLYDPYAVLTISTLFDDEEEKEKSVYDFHSRNFLDPAQRRLLAKNIFVQVFKNIGAIQAVQAQFPPSTHDPTTFTVDVPIHTNKMVLVVDGIFREDNVTPLRNNSYSEYRYYAFRRTFVLKMVPGKASSEYYITNEMFCVRRANTEQIKNSFMHPTRNMNELTLVNPDTDAMDAVTKAFMHITGLKRSEAEARLKLQDWDIRKALKLFIPEFRDNKVAPDKMVEEDDFSDTSSLIDDEID